MDTIPEPCTDITILPYNPDGLPVDLASITTQNVAIEYPSAYATFTTDSIQVFLYNKSPLFRPDTLWIFLMAIPRMKKQLKRQDSIYTPCHRGNNTHGSSGHQVEMVICDFLRSEDAGFLIEDECLAAMTTRAQALTILAGRESVLRGKGARTLMNLHEYLKTHNTFNRRSMPITRARLLVSSAQNSGVRDIFIDDDMKYFGLMAPFTSDKIYNPVF